MGRNHKRKKLNRRQRQRRREEAELDLAQMITGPIKLLEAAGSIERLERVNTHPEKMEMIRKVAPVSIGGQQESPEYEAIWDQLRLAVIDSADAMREVIELALMIDNIELEEFGSITPHPNAAIADLLAHLRDLMVSEGVSAGEPT